LSVTAAHSVRSNLRDLVGLSCPLAWCKRHPALAWYGTESRRHQPGEDRGQSYETRAPSFHEPPLYGV